MRRPVMADPFSETSGALDGLSSQMGRLENLTAAFGRTLSKSLVQGVAQGKSFEDILQGLGDKLIQLSLSSAFKPLESAVQGLFSSLTGTAAGLVSGAFGGGGGGKLFASMGGGGAPLFSAAPRAAGAGITVNMAVTTPDAASFQRSEAQVSAALARAVARGQRSL
jgi:hypothetical protein